MTADLLLPVLPATRIAAHETYLAMFPTVYEAMEFEDTVISAIGISKMPDFAQAVISGSETNDQAVAYWQWLTAQVGAWRNGGA